MSSEEREAQIEAAVTALMIESGLPRFGPHRATVERRQRIAFDAADRAVPVVSEASLRDDEPALCPLARAERAEAAARDFAEALEEIATRSPTERNPDGVEQAAWTRQLIARDILAAHPSFAPSEAARKAEHEGA